jgi:hypothetical protein
MRALFAAIAASLALTGCGGSNVSYVPLEMPPHPVIARGPGSVRVYVAPERPAVPYVRVAEMKVIQDGSFSHDKLPDLLDKLRRAAGEKGCDALVDVEPIAEHTEMEERTPGGPATAREGGTTLEGYRGRCVVFP